MPNPSLPVPNDDPACRCLLEPDEVPDGFFWVLSNVMDASDPSVFAAVRIAYDPQCPYHGPAVAAFQPAPGTYSLAPGAHQVTLD